MGFKTGLLIGIISGWILRHYLPQEFTQTLNNNVTNWVQKLRAMVADLTKPKTQPVVSQNTAEVQSSSPDNLKRIEGIGPKVSELLNSQGILTFTDLASTSIERIKGILDTAGSRYRIIDASTWGEQATLAGNGDWDGLKVLQVKLKGGRRTK